MDARPEPPDWNARYQDGYPPWDTNIPSRELARGRSQNTRCWSDFVVRGFGRFLF